MVIRVRSCMGTRRSLRLLPPLDLVTLFLQTACDCIGIGRVRFQGLERSSEQADEESQPAAGSGPDRDSRQSPHDTGRRADCATKGQTEYGAGRRIRALVDAGLQPSRFNFLSAGFNLLLSHLSAVQVELFIGP